MKTKKKNDWGEVPGGSPNVSNLNLLNQNQGLI